MSGFTLLHGSEAADTHAMLITEWDDAGWPWWSGPEWDLNLFGARSPDRTLGEWDDVIGFAYSSRGQPFVFLARATTDPGREGTDVRSDGFAVLPAGYHRGLFERGTHKMGTPGAHYALRQRRPVMVGRDAIVDGESVGEGESAAHGINLHAPWAEGLTQVKDASHGCQVVWSRLALSCILEAYDRQGGDSVSYALTESVAVHRALARHLA